MPRSIERRGATRGTVRKKNPTAADTVTAITMACNENTIFHPANRAIANRNRMPGQNTDHTADTAHDDRLDQKLPGESPGVAPTARIPISRIRCVTLASMMS